MNRELTPLSNERDSVAEHRNASLRRTGTLLQFARVWIVLRDDRGGAAGGF